MKRSRIRRIVRRRQAAFRFPIKGGRLYLSGHNPLIRAGYPGAIGLKTGYTDEAGSASWEWPGAAAATLAVVLLHSPNPLRHAAKLLDAGFARRSKRPTLVDTRPAEGRRRSRASRARTGDLVGASDALSQLSYGPSGRW